MANSAVVGVGCEELEPLEEVSAISTSMPLFQANSSAILDEAPPFHIPWTQEDPDPFAAQVDSSQELCIYPEPSISFEIEFTNLEDIDPKWDDDEIDEVMVFSSKRKNRRKKLSVIIEDFETPRISTNLAAFGDFIFTLMIGSNGSGKVFLGRRGESQDLFAIKVVQKAALAADRNIQDEQSTSKFVTSLRLPFVARLLWSWQDEGFLYLVHDFCPAGDLLAHITRDGAMHADRVQFYASELVAAISALHAVGIVHRDVKPENILLAKDGHIVLTDFGCAKIIESSNEQIGNTATTCRTKEYQAPEMLLGWSHDYAVDCWGFGLLLYVMTTGRHPFMGSDTTHPAILESRILHGNVFTDQTCQFRPLVRDLISKCLEQNPLLRLKIDGIKLHEYFTDTNWEDVVTKKHPAPFLPEVDDRGVDARYFDREFLDADLEAALEAISPQSSNKDIGGFSFACTDPDNSWLGREAADRINMKDRPQGLGVVMPPNQDVDDIPDLTKAHTESDKLQAPVEALKEDKHNAKLAIQTPDDSVPQRMSSPVQVTNGPQHHTVLRKYSSLNFDLDTISSGDTSYEAARRSHSGKLSRRQSSLALLRTAVSFTSRGDSSPASPRKKLRKKNRPFSSPSVPVVMLPSGISQIGSGIGYTRRVEAPQARLSFSSLTPRTCHTLFSNGFPLGKKSGPGRSFSGDDTTIRSNEDPMNEVMRDIYGSTWELGMSGSPGGGHNYHPSTYPSIHRAGLGWGRTVYPTTSPPGSSFLQDTSHATLRLVTPASTQIDF